MSETALDPRKQLEQEYDYVDSKGKGWRLKKNESLDELKERAKQG